MKRTNLLLSIFGMLLFSVISYAQCTTSSINVEELKPGQKVSIAELYADDGSAETYKHMLGKTVEVGKAGLANIGDCWYLGELLIDGVDVFLVGVKLDIVKGETYEGAVVPVTSEAKSTAVFPVGSHVRILKPEDKPYSLLNELYNESAALETGIVVEADLTPLGDNWYSGKVKIDKGEERTFKKAQFEIIK